MYVVRSRYEQDWLCTEFDGMNATKQNATLGRDWLIQMGNGATKSSVTIQYCMAYPRMVMQSLEIPAVTQVRASCDYHPGNTDGCSYPYCQYNIGTSSLLAYATGLAPSKDNWWSSEHQPGGKFGNATEPYGELGGVITAYSTGPVAIGDGIGFTDVPLVLRACTAASGTLLQPSRPATSIDANFFQAAFGGELGPIPKKKNVYPVWSTHTVIPVCGSSDCTPTMWGHIIAVNLAAPFAVAPAHLPMDINAQMEMVQWTGYGPASNISVAGTFSASKPIALPACAAHDFQLHHVAPVFTLGSRKLALLGEPSKWVPIAARRIARVTVSDTGGVVAELTGDAGEVVEIAFAEGSTVLTAKCTLSSAGAATAAVAPNAKAATCS